MSSVSLSTASRPNILLLLADQHRHDWLPWTPALNGLVRTPNLSALGRSGLRFTQAICPAPLCGPSRACFASGVEYPRCGLVKHESDWPVESLGSHYRLMRDVAGYQVIGCGKFDLRKASHDPGPDGRRHVEEWGFSDAVNIGGKWVGIKKLRELGAEADPYCAALVRAGQAEAHLADFELRRGRSKYSRTEPTPLPCALYVDNWVAATAQSMLEKVDPARPWYCQVNFSGPHEPMDITEPMAASLRGRGEFPAPWLPDDRFDPETHQRIRRNYTAMIENIDARIGDILATLERQGQLDNTIIIYSSDHGEMLGDHRRFTKLSPYQASLGVPLMVAGPGVSAGVVNSSPVSLIDIGATVLDYGNVSPSQNAESISLRPILEGRSTRERKIAFSGLNAWRVAFDGRYKLIRNFNPNSPGDTNKSERGLPPILFDLSRDPGESKDISAEAREIVAELEECLDRNEAAPRQSPVQWP